MATNAADPKIKHTPGPWRVLSAQPSQWPEYVIAGPDRQYVASVQIRANNPAGDNAQLIAAAPATAEAARAMRAALESFVSVFGDGDAGLNSAGRVGLDAELIEARAAIAAAKAAGIKGED